MTAFTLLFGEFYQLPLLGDVSVPPAGTPSPGNRQDFKLVKLVELPLQETDSHKACQPLRQLLLSPSFPAAHCRTPHQFRTAVHGSGLHLLCQVLNEMPRTRLSYQKREKLAQSLSAVFESQDLGDANKVELIRVILPDTTPFLDATDTLDIDLSRLTDERLQAIQELLQQVFYNLGERLPPSPGPHKTRGRPRGRHRVNHLKQKEKVKANMGVLRRQNQKFFSREQVVSLTGVHEEEDELVDVLGFEPVREDPNRFLVYRLNHSATTAY
ncbi:hypothetical protein LAZ67_6001495 [Cordylochernes scorpioides]|uniref:Uncharacterized protein n=1 Tax=Cordylochernes scorpioides TaxID=51811 RepID=A0ABY6KJ60_9ARAC|nr:hypothetical protein LAZ67_6001495 [Cordylochernes scorpioides]